MATNRYGLDRYIPAEERADVRRRCQFGCVFCRRAPVEYDHFDPEFVDARRHDPKGIALLCAYHHGLRTAGALSAKHVEAAMNSLASGAATRVRYDFATMEVQPSWKLQLGHLTLHRGGRFTVNGRDLFSVTTDATGNAVVSATFQDTKGISIASIEENAFITGSSSVADFHTEGKRLVWKLRDGSQRLEAVVHGDTETIEIIDLDMYAEKARFVVDEGRFQLELHFASGWRDVWGVGPFEDMLIDSAGEIRLSMLFGGDGHGMFMMTTPDGVQVKPK